MIDKAILFFNASHFHQRLSKENNNYESMKFQMYLLFLTNHGDFPLGPKNPGMSFLEKNYTDRILPWA